MIPCRVAAATLYLSTPGRTCRTTGAWIITVPQYRSGECCWGLPHGPRVLEYVLVAVGCTCTRNTGEPVMQCKLRALISLCVCVQQVCAFACDMLSPAACVELEDEEEGRVVPQTPAHGTYTLEDGNYIRGRHAAFDFPPPSLPVRQRACSGVRKDHRTAAHAACQPAAPRRCRRANHAVRTSKRTDVLPSEPTYFPTNRRTSQRTDLLPTSRWRKYEVVPRCVGNTIHWNAGALKIKAWHWLAPTTAQWRPGQTGKPFAVARGGNVPPGGERWL